MPGSKPLAIDVASHQVSVTNPVKIFFPEIGFTKGELVEYYLAVADGALRGVMDRPMALKRFVNGATGEADPGEWSSDSSYAAEAVS